MNEEKPIEQKESIKLTKNAKGDYQWEIKVHVGPLPIFAIGKEEKDRDTKAMDRLEKINEELEKKFGKNE